MELSTSGPVTSNGEGKNIATEIKSLETTLIASDNTPEDTNTFTESLIYPDLIPFVPVLIVLVVVLMMTSIKYVIHAIKIRSMMRMTRE